jgi:hypothetical protein
MFRDGAPTATFCLRCNIKHLLGPLGIERKF